LRVDESVLKFGFAQPTHYDSVLWLQRCYAPCGID